MPRAAQLEEFVNPRSMITPGAAAALVATLAGAMFSVFGLTLGYLILLFSFFVGAVVFYSKEFADPTMKRAGKLFFYALNSLIIFSMATGTHAVLDKERRERRSSIDILIPSAHAQTTSAPIGKPLLKQERPVFYDWTRDIKSTPADTSGTTNPIVFESYKDSGALRDALVKAGLATPDYRVDVKIDPAKLPVGAKISSIEWKLPPAYFKNDKIESSQSWDGKSFSVEAWKPFWIEAEIRLTDGRKLQTRELVQFSAEKP